MTRPRNYLNDWPIPRIIIRAAFVLTAVIGLWVSLILGSIRWEVFFAAYFVVQNVEHAAEKTLYALRRP